MYCVWDETDSQQGIRARAFNNLYYNEQPADREFHTSLQRTTRIPIPYSALPQAGRAAQARSAHELTLTHVT